MTMSMTGYGRSQRTAEGHDITVELRSVNHRYFECSVRAPRAYGYLEEKLKSYLQARVSRGKIEAGIFVQTVEGPAAEVQINQALAREYLQALRKMGGELGIRDDISVSTMTRFSDIFTVLKVQEDEDYIWELVRPVADEAVQRFLEMRRGEGERMKADILDRAGHIREMVEQVKARSPETVRLYRERLYQKLQEILEDRQIDEGRVLTEAAVFADRIAVDEETVRLESHLSALEDILCSQGAVGRKLDFLVQEMNREANTIGSKAQDIDIARIVVDVKAEIEKIREQIQNIE